MAKHRSMLSDNAQQVIEACDLVRASGYVVMSQTEHEMWSTWLRESHERCRRAYDETQQALWQVGHLMDRCSDLLGEGRPRWWRDARRWWNQGAWREPIQYEQVSSG